MIKFAIIDAPSNLGLHALGVEQLPTALKAAGLMQGLDAHYAGVIEIPPHDLIRDPETNVLHQKGVAIVTQRLADQVGMVLDDGYFPLVLGGDCSIEICWRCGGAGNMACFFWTDTLIFTHPNRSKLAKSPRWI
jgi:arginase